MIKLANHCMNYKNNFDMAKHYFYMARNACSNESIHFNESVCFINTLLHREFDIKIAIDEYRFVNSENTYKLRKQIYDVLL
jgi:hypothetical protein